MDVCAPDLSAFTALPADDGATGQSLAHRVLRQRLPDVFAGILALGGRELRLGCLPGTSGRLVPTRDELLTTLTRIADALEANNRYNDEAQSDYRAKVAADARRNDEALRQAKVSEVSTPTPDAARRWWWPFGK